MQAIHYSFLPSPIGRLLATAEGGLLTGLYLPDHKGGIVARSDWLRSDESFDALRRQLEDYFAGRLRQFDLPLKLSGTPFQQSVWKELVRIPFGTTISYAELAARIGRPKAARAAGLANSRNPLSIIVPCHRVIGADGSLTGYAGGLETKRWLLDLESKALAGKLATPANRTAERRSDYSDDSTVNRPANMAARSGKS